MTQFKKGDRVRFINPSYVFYNQAYTVERQETFGVTMECGRIFLQENLVLLAPPAHGAEPTPDPISPTAFKADDGKQRFDLLMTKEGCAKAVADVVAVLTFAVSSKEQGGKGYVPHSWRQVPEAYRRYLSALYRHLAALERGEEVDEESGLPHMAHVATNALFLCELTKDAK